MPSPVRTSRVRGWIASARDSWTWSRWRSMIRKPVPKARSCAARASPVGPAPTTSTVIAWRRGDTPRAPTGSRAGTNRGRSRLAGAHEHRPEPVADGVVIDDLDVHEPGVGEPGGVLGSGDRPGDT